MEATVMEVIGRRPERFTRDVERQVMQHYTACEEAAKAQGNQTAAAFCYGVRYAIGTGRLAAEIALDVCAESPRTLFVEFEAWAERSGQPPVIANVPRFLNERHEPA